jgi:hypothetical protein
MCNTSVIINLQAAFIGAVISLVLVGTLMVATQIAVWRGEIVQSTLPLSVTGCQQEMSEPVTR